MILVFGGTTEGLKAVKALEEAGSSFYYSTLRDEQQVTLRHGIRVHGAMDDDTMYGFCRDKGIRLLIDAGHPFASALHQTVAGTAERLGIPAIRFERIFPEHDKEYIEWCDNYDEAVGLLRKDCRCVLATTGVQSIRRLMPLEELGVRMYYRILDRESSIALAHAQGATDDRLCFYHEAPSAPPAQSESSGTEAQADNTSILARLRPDAILMKESGLTGGFVEKAEAAHELGIRVVAIRRPATPSSFHCVNGEHGLRRMVEKLLPGFYPLRGGITTGTCATAATVAATRRLLLGEMPGEVPVVLPNGETICVDVVYGDDYAAVIKDSGDDPDVTNGVEIRATVAISYAQKGEVPTIIADMPRASSALGRMEVGCLISAGPGVGTITLPGFDFPPGSPAINKVPRQMIFDNVSRLLRHVRQLAQGSAADINPSGRAPLSAIFGTEEAGGSHTIPTLGISISVPGGEELARRTFNPRLGIVGGISIVGVSGIIKPFSEDSFVASIRKCMEVAKACGAERIVINSGAKSERYVKAVYPDLPPQAFVEYGNFIGETIRAAEELGIRRLTLGVMLGKAVKLAAGHLDTHSRKATMDKDFIVGMLEEAGCDADTQAKARTITLARELWNIVPPDRIEAFCRTVINNCLAHCRPLLPGGELTILLIDEKGGIHSLTLTGH